MLIAVEGIHGSGKSTQLKLIREWIEKELDIETVTTEWNSYPGLQEFNDNLKSELLFNPKSFSLIHALDFILRYEQVILPNLKKGNLVLSDRYIFTSYVRDSLRGIERPLLDSIYENVIRPDLVFFFDVSPKLTVDRMNRINRTRSHYALGLDLGYNKDITMNFHEYQEQQKNRYLEIFQRYYPDVKIINGDLSIEEQFYLVRITLEEFKNKLN